MFLTMNLTFTIFFTVIAIVGCVVGARYIARFLQVGRAQAGKLVRKAETADPLAMYRHDIDVAKANLEQAENSLSGVKGLMLTAERQVEQARSEKNRLEARIRVSLEANDETAAGLRVQELQVVEKNIQRLEEQHKGHANSYDVFSAKVKHGREHIREACEEVTRLESQLELSKAEVRLGDLSQSFTSKLDNLNEVSKHRDEILKQIDTNKAKSYVQTEAVAGDLAEEAEDKKIKEAEAKALLETYKQRFKKDV